MMASLKEKAASAKETVAIQVEALKVKMQSFGGNKKPNTLLKENAKGKGKTGAVQAAPVSTNGVAKNKNNFND